MAKKIDTAGMWTIKGNPITLAGVFLNFGFCVRNRNGA